MKALVLEEKGKLSLRDFDIPGTLGPRDVRIKTHTVGICGSDVHYYTHGKIGHFVVEAPMVLGHEAAGTVIEVGAEVSHLRPGDRVCMEPGVPDPTSRAAKLGIYNVDPAVTFWATPPVHGCLTPEVIHPAAFTYKLPDNVSFAEGAMVEPFAIGMQAALRARIQPGDVAVVTGAGPIGMMVALAALAGGCARVIVADLAQPKLDIIGAYDGVETVNIRNRPLAEAVSGATGGWGADIVFECSGAAPAILSMHQLARPGGAIVLVGMPVDPVPVDIVGLQAKELRVETVFRYANVYDRAIALIASGKVDLKPLISASIPFEESIAGFDRAALARETDVKLQIVMPE
ncbi:MULTISPECIES: NAD(P)-dependent alcohol dehydrogenase [Paracoccus]|jgi:D-xylulose reductase|uniref:Alcohol dehydrogenase GroES domain protein n=1 Tax=Paracoccus denitrificans (strain Pd 1222) TaxID=318586 RepID=A1B411_PARDP|nr:MULTISPECIES: NAD(P)-dependent alcohol dehydrogenase [Paracoccus]ABL70255.1 Alcohol dehydrogenase GroES domain protein [Paracoccus denitrificans PD1222]MBB4627163.1 D-xylulose reductase [Paracoccus denitrificans]MCU7428064.1 NAD(P)-dependent alcohol dehydrogenase [Paracoccus denitrificans]MDK8873975.1 NAD(P)-dependent alcohol dehydrogenase [Paracoccus sp. SSJ]QAR25606.1 NAD(P)-dependent alcohol dehydrogenase [Paracoccus denitrificans]